MRSQRRIVRLAALVEFDVCGLAAAPLAQGCPELIGQRSDDAATYSWAACRVS
jgi:hypothetical protein